jgi:CrcB protein
MIDTAFPVGTLLVNVSGSFLLGAIIRYALDTPSMTPEIRALLTIGFCGGYTTFSTFSYETVALLEDSEWTRAGVYLVASVTLSIAGTLLGFALARQLLVWRHHL